MALAIVPVVSRAQEAAVHEAASEIVAAEGDASAADGKAEVEVTPAVAADSAADADSSAAGGAEPSSAVGEHEPTPAPPAEDVASDPSAAAAPADDSDNAELLKSLAPEPGSLDEELLEGLVPAEAAGEDSAPVDEQDPFSKIHQKMRQSEDLIREVTEPEELQRLQVGIVRDLDELIKQLKKNAQQSKSQKPSGGQTGQRERVRQPGPPQPGQQQPGAGQPGDPTRGPAKDSSQRADEVAAEKADRAMRESLLKDVWGQLPERLRNQLQQSAVEEFLPDYELLLERYFRTLVEQGTDRP